MTALRHADVPAAPGTHDPGPRDYSAYRVWAPLAEELAIRIAGPREDLAAAEPRAMTRGEGGWFELEGVRATPGARYQLRPGPDAEDALWVPDPRSLFQDEGVHGPSTVVDPRALCEADGGAGRDVRGGVIYEMHVGTFTAGPDGRGGTFDSAIERLDDLVDLGVDAVEVMPVATFPGRRGWGYDGVALYATDEAYGGPEAFARFVAAAHARGLAVILDVVYNHLGPSGNYLGMFGPYFTDAHHTPWGSAVNLDDAGSADVRAFILGTARQWLVDLGLDGLRLDAVHELKDDSDRHVLAELSDAVASWSAALGRPLTLIAESDRNDPTTVSPTAVGGLGMGAQWADDIHHGLHAWTTGEREGYYVDFGDAEVLATVLTRMFLHAGTFSTFRDQVWGRPVEPGTSAYDGHSFVAFLQDHDQVGNRAAGDRIDASITPGAHAAAIALLLGGVTTPMLFQGEEWAASTPFAFFTDHDAELGPLVTKGRTEEFAAMGWGDDVPDPQAEGTFTASILDWDERGRGDHARMLAWYRDLIALRRAEPALRDPSLRSIEVEVLSEETLLMRRGGAGGIAILAHRGDTPLDAADALGEGEVLASFGADAEQPLRLAGPGAIVVRTGA